MQPDFSVAVGAGTLRGSVRADAAFPHRWTDEGVAAEVQFTGAHLLHVSVAACVLNDLYREAARLGVHLDGVRVTADGGFDTDTWRSTGIAYDVTIESNADEEAVWDLVRVVDQVAEIPRALRAGATVRHAG